MDRTYHLTINGAGDAITVPYLNFASNNANNGVIYVAASATNAAIGSIIVGASSSLDKTGAGTVIFSGANQFAGLSPDRGIEGKLLFAVDLLNADRNRVLALEDSLEKLFGQRIFQQMLDCPPQRPGADAENFRQPRHHLRGLASQHPRLRFAIDEE